MSEVTFYDDCYRERIMTFPEYDRSKLKLDLNPNLPLSPMKRRYLSPAQTNAILQSPDLKLLKLASPELEKLIIQGNGLLTTPTPTGTGGAVDVITEEQEQFARGFIEALQKLQNKDDISNSGTLAAISHSLTGRSASTAGVFPSSVCGAESGFSSSERTAKGRVSKARVGQGVRFISTPRTSSSLAAGSISSASSYTSSNNVAVTEPPVVQQGLRFTGSVHAPNSSGSASTTTSSSKLSHPQQFLPASQQQQSLADTSSANAASLFVYTSADSPASQASSFGVSQPGVIKTEEGLQIVPSGALNVSPIDLEQQEKAKHQRKKQRNRLAAQRCRKRKIEREDELKDRVKELKGQEAELKNVARDLRAQVCELKQKVLQHVNSGCRVILPSQSAESL